MEKMKIYLTICSGEKRKDRKLLEAIERYNYPRINKFYELSKKDKVEFRILSGKFGLLKPEDKIPFYDKKLGEKDIEKLSELVGRQIKKEKITEIIFFVRNEKDWKPYIKVVENVCRNLELVLKKWLFNELNNH